MSEQIGKYVHLTWKGYENRNKGSHADWYNSSLSENYIQDKEAAMDIIKNNLNFQSSLTKSEKAEIKSFLNNFKDKTNTSFNNADLYNNIIEFIDNKFQKDVEQGFNQLSYVGSINELTSNQIINQFSTISNNLKEFEPKATIIYKVADFINKFETMKYLIQVIFQNNNIVKDKILKDIHQVEEEFKNLYNIEKQINREIPGLKQFVKTDKISLNFFSKNQSFIQRCNELLRRVRMYNYAAYYEGDCFKYIGQMANLFSQNLAEKCIQEAFESLLKRTNRKSTINNSTLQKIDSSLLLKPFSIQNNKIGLTLDFVDSTSKEQKKIIVKIDFPEKNFPKNLENYEIQNKSKEIFLIENVSLLNLMQNFNNNADAIIKVSNHYLNLFTKKDQKIPSNLQQYRQDVLKAMSKIIIYQAIADSGYGKINSNQLLIINKSHSSKSSIEIFTVAEILEKYNNNTRIKNIKNNFKTLNKNYPNKYIKTEKKGTAFDAAKYRVQNVLFDVHKRKISASINVK